MVAASKVMSDHKGKPCADLPESGRHHRRLIQQTKTLPPIRTAVVHPVDVEALLGAIEAGNAGLIDPVLVGPAAKIRSAAEQINTDISGYELVPAGHRHAAALTSRVKIQSRLSAEAAQAGESPEGSKATSAGGIE